MKRLLFALFATIILSLPFSSCGKYEDGPKINLSSKKSRLSGEWKIEKAMHNGLDVTSQAIAFYGANSVWNIKKDETYLINAITFSDSGTWKLDKNKDYISFTSSTPGSIADTYHILRLKSSELWWKQTQTNGEVHEYHFKQ